MHKKKRVVRKYEFKKKPYIFPVTLPMTDTDSPSKLTVYVHLTMSDTRMSTPAEQQTHLSA